MLRIPHCLDNGLTDIDEDKVVSLTQQPRSTPKKHYFPVLVLISARGWRKPQSLVRLTGLGKLKKNHLIGSRTSDLPACILVPQQPLCYFVKLSP
jgi:hypothetical protein